MLDSTITAKTVVDMTLVLDPAKIWPDPLSCPESPLALGEGQVRRPPAHTRAQAEQRLAKLSLDLHGDLSFVAPIADERGLLRAQPRNESAKLRPPTAAEATKLRELHLVEGADISTLTYATDLKHLAKTETGRAIIMAAQIRGHIRKLDAQTESAKADAETARVRPHKAALAAWERDSQELADRLAALAPAAERHAARLADQRAYDQANDLRALFDRRRMQAEDAARVLGVAAPTVPDVGYSWD